MRRVYSYCAKGGHKHDFDPGNYVCGDHLGAGLFTHCSVCGEPITSDTGRCYVHEACLAIPGQPNGGTI